MVPYYELNVEHEALVAAIASCETLPSTVPTRSPSFQSYSDVWDIIRDLWHLDPTLRLAVRSQTLRTGLRNAYGVLTRAQKSLVCSMAFSSGGNELICGYLDKTIGVWDARQVADKPIRSFICDGRVTSLAVPAAHPQHVLSGDAGGSFNIWDISSGRLVSRISGRRGDVHSVAQSPDGLFLASGHLDRSIVIRKLDESHTEVARLFGHKEPVIALAFAPDDEILWSGSRDSIRQWRWRESVQVGEVIEYPIHSTGCVTLLPALGIAAIGAAFRGAISVIELASGDVRWTAKDAHDAWTFAIEVSPDGKILASGAGDGTVKFWDVGTGTQIGCPLLGNGSWVRCLAFSPDGTTLAAGHQDGQVRIRRMDWS